MTETETTVVPTLRLTRILALCPQCREEIDAVHDPGDGVWIECGCDAGYVTSKRIPVILPDDD